MIVISLCFRADAVVICDGTCHWFPLRVLPLLGIDVIPTIHCVLWTKALSPPRSFVQRALARLNRPFWRGSPLRILSASSDISDQLATLTSGRHPPIIEFLPTYRRGTFREFTHASHERKPFRVFFAGRIEVDKGVFDLLEIARRLKLDARHDIEFDLCGNGSEIGRLREQAIQLGLSDRFRVHGHCDRVAMREKFSQCHIVIVPTTTDFVEGFNQVVVEGVLAGRPVVTSEVCPAIRYVREAIVQVAANDVEGYQLAILALRDNASLYEQKRNACGPLQGQFYDETRGWAAALERAIEPL